MNTFRRRSIFIFWTVFILIFTLISFDFLVSWVKYFVYLSSQNNLPRTLPTMVFHFTAYFIWAFLLVGAVRKRYFMNMNHKEALMFFSAVLVFSFLQEGLQFVTPGRCPSIIDTLINILGGVTGLALCYFGNLLEMQFIKSGNVKAD